MVEGTTDDLQLRRKEETVMASRSSSDAHSILAKDAAIAVSHGDNIEGEHWKDVPCENSHPECPPDATTSATRPPEAIQKPEVLPATPTTIPPIIIIAGKANKLSREQPGTKTGCLENSQLPEMGCSTSVDKRELSTVDSSVQGQLLFTASKTGNCDIGSTHKEGGGAEGRDSHDVGTKENLPAKRIKLETEATGGNDHSQTHATGLQEGQRWPLLEEKGRDSSPSTAKDSSDQKAEVVAMAATTRSMTSSMGPRPPKRPTILNVAPRPSVELNSYGNDTEDMFIAGEEERTPVWETREFVGHPYKCHLINNGEVVITPDKSPTLPNMVTGYTYPLEAYRRQFSENNACHHSLSRREGFDENTQHAYRRVNSAPPPSEQHGESYEYIDNNGRRVSTTDHPQPSTPPT